MAVEELKNWVMIREKLGSIQDMSKGATNCYRAASAKSWIKLRSLSNARMNLNELQ